MISNSHELTIQFFDAQGGDAIWIRYLGDDLRWHNILIDGGFIGSYSETFKPVINAISTANEYIDLWVITHIDLDHIGAIVSFARDSSIPDKEKLVRSYWFNHTGFTIPDTSGRVGYRQGIDLRSYLQSINQLTIEQITDMTGARDFYGLKLTVLSPTAEKIAAANHDWIQKEKQVAVKMARKESDHHKKIEDFDGNDFVENTDLINGSSITFILNFKGIQGLFLADGHPTDVVISLKRLNYNIECPLLLSFVKVSHHGSKQNTSPELLRLIRTGVYVISANGISNKHPHKETLARILRYHNSIGQHLKFLYTANTPQIKALFNVDENPQERYNFSQVFIEDGQSQTTLSYRLITA
jgi:beta-lactamase superfamily II metal-dependent hydrolase